MIMKRVKTASPTPADRNSGQQPSSEPPSMASSMTASVTASNNMTASTGGSATAFKSPLLQGLMAKQQASGETTPEKKFSSPLLNNLMGKCSMSSCTTVQEYKKQSSVCILLSE